MERIFLVGFMGVGKTTVGRRLATLLGWSFVDLDLYIEHRFRQSVATLFHELGEAEFRRIEHEALMEVATYCNVVISTGGGAPCFMGNMESMLKAGGVVYLMGDEELLYRRLVRGRERRPLIAGMNNDELKQFITNSLKSRSPYYTMASLVVPITKNHHKLDSLSEEIATWKAQVANSQ